MAVDFFIPKLGDNVDKVTIVNWLVDDGVEVQEGDDIVEVETDKAVVPVPANGQGVLHIGPYKAGDSVPVMTVVATIGEGESVPSKNGETTSSSPLPEGEGPGERAETKPTEPEPTTELPKITPVAQKMAADMGVDLRTLAGSERITKEDILQAAAPAQPRRVPERLPHCLRGVQLPGRQLSLPGRSRLPRDVRVSGGDRLLRRGAVRGVLVLGADGSDLHQPGGRVRARPVRRPVRAAGRVLRRRLRVQLHRQVVRRRSHLGRVLLGGRVLLRRMLLRRVLVRGWRVPRRAAGARRLLRPLLRGARLQLLPSVPSVASSRSGRIATSFRTSGAVR
ncbi:MAG: hypothetical protein HC875_41395, partial [Anaerolineales bacterium]|nr:hypothetical protein [Anaerolineales bacterium]